jgi:uncharacterized protein (TIGR02300 family)
LTAAGQLAKGTAQFPIPAGEQKGFSPAVVRGSAWLLAPSIRPAKTKRLNVAKPDIGTKRICPDTGRKFYDLNKDPIVSPYTGKSYPLNYFQSVSSKPIDDEEEIEEKEVETEEDSGPEIVALEDADDDDGDDDKIPGIEDEEDVDLGDDDDDDTFLADDDDDDDDVSDIIGVDDDEDN